MLLSVQSKCKKADLSSVETSLVCFENFEEINFQQHIYPLMTNLKFMLSMVEGFMFSHYFQLVLKKNFCSDPDLSGFEFYLDASISTTRRIDEDRLTYLNKGMAAAVSACVHTRRSNLGNAIVRLFSQVARHFLKPTEIVASVQQNHS
jgi:hypothetical protein